MLGGQTFKFAFWAVKVTNIATGDAFSYQQAQSNATIDVSGQNPSAQFTGEAKAYYVWVPSGGGPGGGYVLIDAFDSTINDFIPDDPFVEVSTADVNGTTYTPAPYPSDPLSAAANDMGYFGVAQNMKVKISAIDPLVGPKPFTDWLSITTTGMATVGQGNPHECIVYYGDVVVAYAVYREPAGKAHIQKEVKDVIAEGKFGTPWAYEKPQVLDTPIKQVGDNIGPPPVEGDLPYALAQISQRLGAIEQFIPALTARLGAVEQQVGQAFIRSQERPAVGEQIAARAAAPRRGFLWFGRGKSSRSAGS
jgi:hypothetical protein